MCVICIKKMGKKFPSRKSIQNCVTSNPDGFSMMWNQGGKVHTYKTLKVDEFLKTYDEFVKSHNHKDTALVIHARIKTHGSLKISNCHCWPALDDSIGFAHNGILSIANRGDMTDSETYFRDIFVPVFEFSNRDWKIAGRTVNACIGTSKFAFLEGDGTIHHYGHYIKHDGALYSNSSYEDKVYYTYSNPTKGYSYSGKWSSNRWSADYYSKRDFMYIKGANIPKGDITDERWSLMCKYYFGVITESEYCDAVVLTDRAKKDSVEWWLDEGAITIAEYTTYAANFVDKMRWEFFVLYCYGKINSKEYYNLIGHYVDEYDDWDLPLDNSVF